MPTTAQTLLGLGFGARDVAFLERIVRGGRAGGAGARYEDWYATYRLLIVARTHLLGGGDASVETQALAFVNDVVVHDVTTDYCQAKTSPTARWDAKLRRQFRLQHRLCRLGKDRHRLLLVTPHSPRVKSLRRSRPAVAARVELFPQTLPWDPTSPAAGVLRDLSADPHAGPSQTEAVAKAYASVLLAVPAGQRCSASSATAAVRTIPAVLVRSAAQPPAGWPPARALLAAIPGLTIVVDRGVCLYEHGPERGVVAACDSPSFVRFVERVLERRPATFSAFSKELP